MDWRGLTLRGRARKRKGRIKEKRERERESERENRARVGWWEETERGKRRSHSFWIGSDDYGNLTAIAATSSETGGFTLVQRVPCWMLRPYGHCDCDSTATQLARSGHSTGAPS